MAKEVIEGLSQFKRPGLAGMFLIFCWNNNDAPSNVVWTAAGVCVVYMILDTVKHWRDK